MRGLLIWGTLLTIFAVTVELDYQSGEYAVGLGAMYFGLAIWLGFILAIGFICQGAAWTWAQLRRK